MAKVIVFGNEKGGSGKTTSAMHTAVTLLKMGYNVAALDLDIRQKSLSTYIENRATTVKSNNLALAMPICIKLETSDLTYDETISGMISIYDTACDFIIIDTPGSDTELSRAAHSYADIIVTPINDSFVDIDLLGRCEPNALNVVKPGVYSAMVWEQKIKRAARDKKEVDWVVVRNRISSLDTNNKKNIEVAIRKLSKKFGFRVVRGFGDRVIFKELFLSGLTLHDTGITDKIKLTHSVIAARQELREFVAALAIENRLLDNATC